MNKTLKILAIDDDTESLEITYNGLKRALSQYGVDLECRIVKNYDRAIDELKSGFRPDAITNDYMMRGYEGIGTGPYGYKHLEKTLDYIDKNIPDYKPQPFMMTASTNEAGIQIKRSKTLAARGTQLIDKIGVNNIIHHLESLKFSPLEKDTDFSRFLRNHCGKDVITSKIGYSDYKENSRETDSLAAQSSSVLSHIDLSDRGDKIKSLLPYIDDGIEEKTFRLDCLKSNNMPVNGYVAFNKDDVKKLLDENKQPILFIENYKPEIHASLLTKVAGVVCLGKGGSHLLERGIPAIGKADGQLWNGQRIDYCRIEKFDGKNSVVNNSDAVKTAVYNWQLAGSNLENPPKPEYDDPQKHKTILFQAGDEVTLARNSAYQGHLEIKYPDVTNIAAEVDSISAKLPFKHPRFLATLSSASDWPKGVAALNTAIKSGAEGVGLVRTEYMYGEDTLESIKQGILTNDPSKLSRLSFHSWAEYNGLDGMLSVENENLGNREPLRIRLFDFPPDEFFSKKELKALKERVGDDVRGTPLALKTVGLYENQLKEIFNSVKAKNFYTPQPINLQIMAPNIRNADEMEKFVRIVEKIADKYGFERSHYKIGAMMETKQACQPEEAEKIAKLCDFVSFGTNDLTQEITGIKRSFDGEGFNPYKTLCEDVRKVMEEAVNALRKGKPDIIIGCCGGQMRDVDSLVFCAKDLQLDDVSVPPDPLHLLGRRLQLLQKMERHHEAHNSVTANPKAGVDIEQATAMRNVSKRNLN